jgi:hypothetical protein
MAMDDEEGRAHGRAASERSMKQSERWIDRASQRAAEGGARPARSVVLLTVGAGSVGGWVLVYIRGAWRLDVRRLTVVRVASL